MDNTFTYKGINSSKFGILLEYMPTRATAARQVQYISIPGRDGHLIYDDPNESLAPISIIPECSIEDVSEENLREIKRWLSGSGELIFSDEPNVYWKARLDTQIDYSIPLKLMHQFALVFDCFPYAFTKRGDKPLVFNPTTTLWQTIMMNEYSRSLPHIKIFAQGDVGLNINGVENNFYSINNYIECDSELQQCYKGNMNLGMNMSGEFPVLVEGKNVIQFTGKIEQVIITPHWRLR